MRASTQYELRKLREIVRFVLRGKRCYFCGKLLLDEAGDYLNDGNGRAKPLDCKLTIHHIENDRDCQTPASPKDLAHTTCHKRFEALLTFGKRTESQALRELRRVAA